MADGDHTQIKKQKIAQEEAETEARRQASNRGISQAPEALATPPATPETPQQAPTPDSAQSEPCTEAEADQELPNVKSATVRQLLSEILLRLDKVGMLDME